MRTLILTLILGITLFLSCTNSVENKTNSAALPPGLAEQLNTTLTNLTFTDLNCWVEREHFFVIGVCNNFTGEWSRIWLRMTPTDDEGNPITVNGAPNAVFPTLSDAVPPHGRTSFFFEWPLSAFPTTPDSFLVAGAGAVVMPPGAILITTEQSGVKVLVPATAGDTIATVEKAWRVSTVVENPLDLEAAHPRIELLLYGTDQRLWFSSVLNPEDTLQVKTLKAERDGPMAPKEKRRFGSVVFYDNLPQALKEKKIGQVKFLPFNARF